MERDFSEAVTALEQVAKQGDEASQIRLGKLLLSGDTVEKDEAQAYFWFCKAAEKENEIAKMWKGHCLLYGLGVPKRAHLAGYYFSMVAEGGWPEAIEKMTHYKEHGLFIKRWKRID